MLGDKINELQRSSKATVQDVWQGKGVAERIVNPFATVYRCRCGAISTASNICFSCAVKMQEEGK